MFQWLRFRLTGRRVHGPLHDYLGDESYLYWIRRHYLGRD